MHAYFHHNRSMNACISFLARIILVFLHSTCTFSSLWGNKNKTKNGESIITETTKTAGGGGGKVTTKKGSKQLNHKKQSASSAATAAVAGGPYYVGDGNDPVDQQMANWRWMAGRYHDTLLFASSVGTAPTPLLNNNYSNNNMASEHFGDASAVPPQFSLEVLSAGFIGQVVKVKVQSTATTKSTTQEQSSSSSSSSSFSTIAMVTIRRLFLPEHTSTGRLPQHRPKDLFEDADNCDNDYHDSHDHNVQNSSNSRFLLQVPIEQLVVMARKLEKGTPTKTETDQIQLQQLQDDLSDSFHVTSSYSMRNNMYEPLQSIDGNDHNNNRDNFGNNNSHSEG